MTNLAEVVTLYEANASDPAAMARKLGDDIAAGEHGDVRMVTAVLERQDGSVEVFGWGDSGLLRSIGLLHLGIAHLAAMRLEG